MTFLNWAMVFGTAAFTVPLVIHLLNRSRYKTVRWGAMHFLSAVVHTNRRQLQFEQWILLLLRCSIPIVLALCLAQPLLTGWRALSGDTPSSTVVLLDASYSMQSGSAVRTHFQAAVEEIGRALSAQKPGSDATVFALNNGVHPVLDGPTTNLPFLVDHLQELRPEGGPIRAADAFSAAASLLPKMAHSRRGVVVVSDFQRGDWLDQDGKPPAALVAQVKAVGSDASVFFLRAGSSESPGNVCVESIEAPRGAVSVGQLMSVRATLRNYGDNEVQALRVYFRVDGKQHAASQVSLVANGTSHADFTCRITEPGSHVLEVEADSADLKFDNVCSAAVEILDRMRVLIIDGNPQPKMLAGESGYLRAALQPYTLAGGEPGDLFEAETVGFRDFRDEHLVNKRAVVLCGVPRLDEGQLQALQHFVNSGGGLLVFAGEKADSAFYNGPFFEGGSGLLPAQLGEPAGDTRDASKHTTIHAQRYEHPTLAFFNDPQNGDLGRAVVKRWHRLKFPAAQSTEKGTGTLIKLTSGDPLIVEKRFGAGNVVLAAISSNPDASTLPLRPVFVPLTQRLLASLCANSMPLRNLRPGSPLVAFLDAGAAQKTLVLTDPHGQPHDVPTQIRGGQVVAEYGNARIPGVYVLRTPAGAPVHFVVETQRSESQLRALSSDALRDLAKSCGATVIVNAEELQNQDRDRSVGRDIWKPLLAVALLLMFGEQYLAQRFARARPPLPRSVA